MKCAVMKRCQIPCSVKLTTGLSIHEFIAGIQSSAFKGSSFRLHHMFYLHMGNRYKTLFFQHIQENWVAVKADITVCFISSMDAQTKIAFSSQNANTVLLLYINPWIYCKSTDKTSTTITYADYLGIFSSLENLNILVFFHFILNLLKSCFRETTLFQCIS